MSNDSDNMNGIHIDLLKTILMCYRVRDCLLNVNQNNRLCRR
jgi:hypothetical protein